VMSGRGLCDELITRPEDSYQLRCIVVCDLETSLMRGPWPTAGCCAQNKHKTVIQFARAVSFLIITALDSRCVSCQLSLRNKRHCLHYKATERLPRDATVPFT